MKVKLNSKWQTYAAGSVVEVEDATGKSLILAEIASEYDEKAEKAESDRNESLKNTVEKAVVEAVKAIKVPSMNLNFEVKEAAKPVYKTLGEQLFDIKNAASGKVSEKLIKAAMGANEMVDSEGGYLVQQDFLAELLKLAGGESVLAPRCQTTSVQGNGLYWNELNHYNRTDGCRPVSVYRLPEAGAKTASKPAFARRSLQLHKLAGLFYATDELLEDASALDGEVRSWFGEEFGFVIDDEIIRGTGVGQMLGILTSPALVTVTKAGARTAATFSTDIVNMYSRMHARSLARAEWYINSEVLPYILLLEISNQPAYIAPGRIGDAPGGYLLGRPVNIIEQCSALASVGDIIFADFSQYKIINKAAGIQAASSIHVKFTTDETVFRFVVRNNGAPAWSNVITPANGTATKSPFVTLGA